MRNGSDACSAMYVHADVTVLMAGRLTRVQAHPHPDNGPIRPVMARKCQLRHDAATHRVASGLEDDEKAVTLGPQLDALVKADIGTQQDTLCGQRLGVAVTQTAQEHSRR